MISLIFKSIKIKCNGYYDGTQIDKIMKNERERNREGNRRYAIIC